MASLESQFININKKIRQELAVKMQAKMDRAAEKVASKVSRYKDYNDVTGNLYKSTAVGTYYKGKLINTYHVPGPSPTRKTLARGERYNLEAYYNGWDTHLLGRPFVGQLGKGGEDGESAGEKKLLDSDKRNYLRKDDLTWQMKVVAGVEYASYVEKVKKHDVLTGIRQYIIRYFKTM